MDVDNNDHMKMYISNSLKEHVEVKGANINVIYE